MSAAWIIGLVLSTIGAGSFWLTFRLIGTVGEHAGGRNWQDRPLFPEHRYDQLDRLAARYYMPDRALDDLYRVDRLLADIDAILRPAVAR